MITLEQLKGRYLGRWDGHDRWEWEVALKADNQLELELVDRVVYQLHDSYDVPRRVVDTPEDNFALVERSTGVFTVKARAMMKAGAPHQLERRLELYFPAHLESSVYDL